ncbi:MAG TPA: bifunctional phosphoribosyl-AMP cyclohydrolase/phosphoribosyl-ATP diphosphatase HisIE [Limnochordia bacterium]|jgi:phosphoribosyl-ATP pyrophosphohydrolase/phosphoribosyl-AMP cyclohydrolase|nr:bifunctional phosphoribosyl-AMP cyclohydrolase/phosphoribosyl-ATP diphosphatase HisIE [Bacillota bacterium]HOB09056.1 bifunctional phosphoribosyl-AMP cyclohydrolase/phosphoribosyl-ATP diphosphatase HisIE [Limnochordia bacterium]NLH30769.1 bifunctional phosphoribosyl-AMP cyclohydrolase/phosphoribosyl-ATP diphosphatase HisIE [Bacillota bacterium]HPT92855.1 bifunctional phosphoribosyl-AMP cyclohydrolase/phosphoribosyl-ATP diphosphatase HisIE [Limnochordia bacterium]HPZ31199.1 bifunctional phosp
MELKFNDQGLIPVIVRDQEGEVLMLAYMNQEALDRTLATGYTWFYSRSRQRLWQKGESSGHRQRVIGIAADCDYDTLLITVDQFGPGACHEGYKSCFHNPIRIELEAAPETGGEHPPAFDPEAVYGSQILNELYQLIRDRKEHPQDGSYTNYLFEHGIDKILKKVGEEAAEVIIAAKNEEQGQLVYEVSDLVYHLLVMMVEKEVTLGQIWQELASRRK